MTSGINYYQLLCLPTGVDIMVIAEKKVVARDIEIGKGETYPPIKFSLADFFRSFKPKYTPMAADKTSQNTEI